MCGLDGANPFQIDGPPRHRQDFVGRSREVRRVLEFLGKGQSVSIVGPRGCGKTWFLDHVADLKVYEQYGLRAGEYVFVRIDGRSFVGVDQATCLHGFHQGIVSQLERFDAGLEARLVEASPDTGIVGHRGLRTLFRIVQDSGVKPIVQLDEFDELAQNARLEDNFFAALRSLAMGYEMAYLIASRRPLYELEKARPEASTLCGICQQFQFRPFTEEESQRLVQDYLQSAGVEFPRSTVERIVDLGRNEPHRIQLAGYYTFEVWRESGERLCQESDAEIERRFTRAVESRQRRI